MAITAHHHPGPLTWANVPATGRRGRRWGGSHGVTSVVDRDDAQTVTLYRLTSDNTYTERAKMPLAWLLQTDPGDHLG